MSAIHPPRVVNSTLNYYSPSSSKEPDVLYPGTAGYYRRKWDARPVAIHDIRTTEEKFTLDKHGFEVFAHRSSETKFLDDAQIKKTAYPEAIDILKKATNATTVIPVSHLIRRQSQAATLLAGRDLPDSAPISTPTSARYVHVDQSPFGAEQLLRSTLPGSHPSLPSPGQRWGSINIWRPIGRPVEREAVAVCDIRSVGARDLRPIKLEFPTAEGPNGAYKVTAGDGYEICVVAPNVDHRWWYADALTPEEVLLIKIFDSAAAGATGTPHSAFEGEGERGRPARESIEIRCLVFWDGEE